DITATGRKLFGNEFRLAEAGGPIRYERAVCGARHRILAHPCARSEESRDEVDHVTWCGDYEVDLDLAANQICNGYEPYDPTFVAQEVEIPSFRGESLDHIS